MPDVEIRVGLSTCHAGVDGEIVRTASGANDRFDAPRLGIVDVQSPRIEARGEHPQGGLAVRVERVPPRDRHGEGALAAVEGEVCGGCYHKLTPQTMNELKMSKVVFCKSCGCMLYLPEERSVGQVETQP